MSLQSTSPTRHGRSFSARLPFGLIGLVWGLGLMLPSPARAEVSSTLTYAPYIVDDAPGRPLESVLLAASPFRQDGREFMGNTHWNIQWHFRSRTRGNGPCEIVEVKTVLTVTITMPRLVSPSITRANTFLKILTDLRVHELGHYAIAEEAANAIDARIAAVPPMARCDALATAANAAGTAALQEFEGRQKHYDQVTDHGRLQRAWTGP